MTRSITIGAVCLLLFGTCGGGADEPPVEKAAYYHWQTQLGLDSVAVAKMIAADAERLYVKYFDVDWDVANQRAVPLAVLEVQAWPEGVDIVPTVFLTNRTFEALPLTDVAALAAQVWSKIATLLPPAPITEIQMDCDWTRTTRDAYFAFLHALQQRLPAGVALSATIRLHQYRYPDQTGIPPVDRGMLMFYNMGRLEDPEEPNSILNMAAAQPYLQDAPAYPMPLDVALPVFRWGILYRDGQLIKLIHDLAAADLADTARFARVPPGTRRQPSAPPGQGGRTRGRSEDTSEAPGRLRSMAAAHDDASPVFTVRKNTYLHGYYLYEGDRIRTEAVTPNLLRDARLAVDNIPTKGRVRYVAYYHLGSHFFLTTY